MTESTISDERPSVLVPIQVLEGETLPEGIPELLRHAHVVVLGYHELPEQTPPGQGRMQFEERAQRKLEEFETVLETAGATVERRLVFTHDGQQTIDRTIKEHDCLAVLVPNSCDPPESVFVPIRGTVGASRLVSLVSGLFADENVDVTLFHGLVDDESEADAEAFVDGIADRLDDAGVERDRIRIQIDTAAIDVDRIATLAEDHDVVVMGESDPSVVTFVFGMPATQLSRRFLGPILVVQREE